MASVDAQQPFTWALLLPITSWQATADCCWKRLEKFAASLLSTTANADRQCLHIFVGIDLDDPIYDNDMAKKRLQSLFTEVGLVNTKLHFQTLHGCSGMICKIWNELAASAYSYGIDFYVLLGDDIELDTLGWKSVVEETFHRLAEEMSLPFGCACVCFRDKSFVGFPTFPVMHKFHLNVFQGQILPSTFVNQDGDPYLFALYRRWGTAEFCDAMLNNSIGGATDARYLKQPIPWKRTILPEGLRVLEETLGPQTHVCLDVVVPTFRCDMFLLEKIIDLKIPKNLSITYSVVVDDPGSPRLPDVQGLALSRGNVRLRVHNENLGVSAARNTGIAVTDGDWVLFLDDDVDVGDSDLLWWYLQAITRYPDATGFVGLTELPVSTTLWTEALVLSGITYFYGITKHFKRPPWGVGANLMLKRTKDGLFFREYRKAGGGEDVDVCLRMRRGERGLIAVVQAAVKHPWWRNGGVCYRHVAGWAVGDSLCVSYFPHHAFCCAPSSAIIILLLCLCGQLSTAVLVQLIDSAVIALTLLIQHGRTFWHLRDICVAVVASSIILVQEMTRMMCYFRRGEPLHIFYQFDWLENGGRGEAPMRANRFILCLIVALMRFSTTRNVSRIGLTLLLILSVPSLIGGRRQRRRQASDFVVLSHKRSGSNLLCGILHLHPEILMHNELFNASKIFSYHKDLITSGGWDVKKRNGDPKGFLEWICQQRAPYIRPTVGFKSFDEHWDGRENVYKSFLSDCKVKKILLRRRNLLDTYVSHMRSSNTNLYIKERYEGIRVKVDKNSFLEFVDNYVNTFERYEEATKNQQTLSVYYEDLIGKDQARVIQTIYKFLDVTISMPIQILPETRQRRGGNEAMEHVIENYQELLNDPQICQYLSIGTL